MANNNIYSLQLLRNSTVFETKELAYNALSANTAGVTQDGVAVLARYKADGNVVKTLVGYYAKASDISGATGRSDYMTIIDVEGAAADVEKLRTEINNRLGDGITSANTAEAQLAALSGSTASTSAETSVEGAKRYTDGKLDALDYTLAKDDNKVVVSFEQTNGKISGTSANITSVKLGGYAEGSDADIAATDTLGQALGKLQAQINAMDKDADVVAGQVVTTVAETDGKVTETKANVKDLQLGGYAKTNDTGDIASADTINVALSKLENKAAAITIANADGSINVTTASSGTDINVNIKSGEHVLANDGNAGIYTNIAISAVSDSELTTNLGTNVKEAYKLVGTDGTKLGEYIKIYKDSSLVDFRLGHIDDKLTDADPTTHESPTSGVTNGTGNTALVYIMQLANGNYKLAAVDVESFLQEAEFASGVTVDSGTHVVHGVVDPASEKDESNAAFLTVGADGFKVSGIENAIDTKINKLDAVVTGGTTAGTETSKHVQVVVGEADGKLTGVTVTETNVADKNKLEELSAKTVTEITSSNGSIEATSASTGDGTVKYDIITDASKIKMSGFTADESGFTAISESSSITEAFKAVEAFTLENEEVISSALNDLNDRINELSGGTSADLAAEIAERRRIEGQSASSYTANASSRYISGASDMNAADVALNNAIVGVADNYVSGATMNGKAVSKTGNTLVFSAVATSAATEGSGIVITTDANGGLTFALGTIDAGTY